MSQTIGGEKPPAHDNDITEPPIGVAPESGPTFFQRVRRFLIGAPRNIKDPGVFHKISLIAFLAWVGLGADGLSSSAYGPDESFRALGGHTYLALGLALATSITVFIISYAYSRIIEHFPSGGGGYLVASRLLSPKFGVVSGSALLIDYVLTISVSIASGADQIFSLFPAGIGTKYKMVVVVGSILLLTILNLRGVKESVATLLPIFFLFLVTHIILIAGGIGSHLTETAGVAAEVQTGFNSGLSTLGFAGLCAIFLRAYSMGGGTYTGIEAVSNGIQMMREPKLETAKRTMAYLAFSLSLTAGGILLCYLLYHAVPETGKTMNAVLLQRFAGSWSIEGLPVGKLYIMATLLAEAALLFVAALAGFIAGPRVMANMATDLWLPHRFSSLSDRLTMQNGVILISGSAICILLITGGNTSTLVLMYSINVFLTFSLSQMGMVRYWVVNRKRYPDWSRHIIIHVIGLILCLSILTVAVIEKFMLGGWITLVITAGMVGICIMIRRHYNRVRENLRRLDDILTDIPLLGGEKPPALDRKAQTAVLLVNTYGGLGIHSFLNIQKLFPKHFRNFIFISINVIDAGNTKGADDLSAAEKQTEESLKKYCAMASQLGFAATYRMGEATEVIPEAERLSLEIAQEFPHTIFFTSKLVFQREKWYQRVLHNETATELQRRLQFAGLNTMVLPIRVFSAQDNNRKAG